MNREVAEAFEIVMLIAGGIYLLGLGFIMTEAAQNGSELVMADWKMPFETLFVVMVSVFLLSKATWKLKRFKYKLR